MALTGDKIEAIRHGVDIVDVIGGFVTLKKRGQRYLGLCPFHSEKTPSFSVSSEKGFFYCFGCHASGDVFSFVMRHQGLDFKQAARWLAPRAGVELTPESPREQALRAENARLHQACRAALSFFEKALRGTDGRPAQDYWRSRGVDGHLARFYRLGYGGAPGALVRFLEARGVAPALGAAAGFLTEDGQRSLFDQRVIFPIFDAAGQVVAFGGRRLGEQGPKYINSRESVAFSKGRSLFGWPQAEGAIRQRQRVVVVEGYMDVLACHRAGIGATVAALGTALTPEHAKQCARLAKEAVVLFDGDQAGLRASQQATEQLLRAGLKVLLAPLPEGADPASMVEAGALEALQQSVGEARPALEVLIERALPASPMSIEDRVGAAESLAPLLVALPTGLEHDLYLARLADRVGVSVDQLADHLRRRRRQQRPARPAPRGPEPAATEAPVEASGPSPWELRALAELLLYPGLRPRFAELAEFGSDPMRVLLDALATSEEPVEAVLGRHISDPRQVKQCLPPRDEFVADDADSLAHRTFEDVLRRLKERHLALTKRHILEQLHQAAARGDDTDELVRRLSNLTRRKRQLKRSQAVT